MRIEECGWRIRNEITRLSPSSEPAIDHQKCRPIPRMHVTGVGQKLELAALQRHSPGHRLILQLTIELRHKFRGHLVMYLPQRGHGTASTSADSNPGQAQGRTVIALGGVAGAQRQKFERVVTVLE